MSTIPQTRISILNAISNSAASSRWAEFIQAYEKPMRDYLRAHYPSVEADDALQETMLALVKALPDYHYTPDEKGHFRNYLFGILRHKAIDLLDKSMKQTKKIAALSRESETGLSVSRSANEKSTSSMSPLIRPQDYAPAEDDSWKQSVLEVAMEQLMSDQSVSARNREVFRHVALLHEPPESVALQFGITRNNVDQIKKRMIDRLSAAVEKMVADA